MVFKILVLNEEVQAWAKSSEYFHGCGGATRFRWAVDKHPTQDKWSVSIPEEDWQDLSEEDFDALVEPWVLPSEGLYE
jgi:hypothetical protein